MRLIIVGIIKVPKCVHMYVWVEPEQSENLRKSVGSFKHTTDFQVTINLKNRLNTYFRVEIIDFDCKSFH